jgi:hypothetical protein
MAIANHRRKLNAEQLEVLELLYKFRFGSNDLFAQYFGKKDRSFVFKRLKILLEQGLIGKRFDSSYRIQGKPAAYYLLPDGARMLQGLRPPEKAKEITVKGIYNDKNVSEEFVGRCLKLFAIHNQLKTHYGDAIKLFTKTSLALYDYFPRPLPDAYIALKVGGDTKRFFLEMFDESEPPFTTDRRLQKLIEYYQEETWPGEGGPFPPILCVCDTGKLEKQVTKQISRALCKNDEEMEFYATTLGALKRLQGVATVWSGTDKPEALISLEGSSSPNKR